MKQTLRFINDTFQSRFSHTIPLLSPLFAAAGITFVFSHALRFLIPCYSPSLTILLLHYPQIAFMGRATTPDSPYIIHTQLLPLTGCTPSNLWKLITANALAIFHAVVLCNFFAMEY